MGGFVPDSDRSTRHNEPIDGSDFIIFFWVIFFFSLLLWLWVCSIITYFQTQKHRGNLGGKGIQVNKKDSTGKPMDIYIYILYIYAVCIYISFLFGGEETGFLFSIIILLWQCTALSYLQPHKHRDKLIGGEGMLLFHSYFIRKLLRSSSTELNLSRLWFIFFQNAIYFFHDSNVP